MAETSLLLIPAADSAVLAAFEQVASRIAEQNAPTLYLGFFSSASHNWDGPLTAIAQNDESNPYPDHRAVDGILAKKLQVSFQDQFGASLELIRDWDLEEKPQAGVDRLKLLINNRAPLDRQMLFLSATRAAFSTHLRETAVEMAVEPVVRDAYAVRETALARLEELSHRLIESNQEYRRSVDLQLQHELENQRTMFEARRAEVHQDMERLKNQVDNRQAELDRRERELDDRDNTHVRREHHRKFIEKVTRPNPAALSPETGGKRLPVRIAFYLLTVTTLTLLGAETYRFLESGTVDVPRLVGVALAAISFLGIAIYYIRWEDAWAVKHASEETRIRRLGLDFDRASWVVEMALEWKDKKDQPIPHELLDRLTEGLFHDDGPDRQPNHPAHDLATLLGGASGLKLKTGVGEFEYSRRDLRNLSQD